MIPEEHIGKTITRKWKSENGKNEYTVTCNYPDEEHAKIINENVKTFYQNYFQSRYTPKELNIMLPVMKRYCELEKQGLNHEEIQDKILKEWEEKRR